MPERRAVPLVLAVCAAALGGCESVSGLFAGGPKADPVPLARALDRQIMELDLLRSAPYQERVAIFTTIELDYANEPSDSNRLRLALAKSVEGHPNTDLAAAFKELQALLVGPNTLSPTQLHLANIVSQRVEESLAINEELNDLRAQVSRFETADSAANSQADRRVRDIRARLRAAEEDNARLREELARVQRQLDEIMSLETASDPGL